MVRVVVMFVAVLYLSAATGFAQSVKEITTQPAAGSATKQAQKLDVSAKAAGLDRIAAGERSAVKSTTTPAPRAMSKRNKILIISAAVLAAVIVGIAVSGGYGSDDGYQ